MPNCQTIDPLVTPYVDGELAAADRRLVDEHLVQCPPCHARVAAERAVHDLIDARKQQLTPECASATLRARCAEISRVAQLKPGTPEAARASSWRARVPPLAMAASLVLVVG